MGCNSKHSKLVIFLSVFIISCSNTNIVESLNKLDYDEAILRLNNSPISWETALLNNKIAFESRKLKPIKIDSILILVNIDSTFSVRKFESFYRKLNFFHPYVSKQLIQIEINQKRIIKPFFFTTELIALLKSKKPELHSFAFEQFYLHINPNELKFLASDINQLKKQFHSSFKDSLSFLSSHLNQQKKTEKGVFKYIHFKKVELSKQIQTINSLDDLYSILISGTEHSSYKILNHFLTTDSLRDDYKRSLISSFNSNRNDSLSLLLNESYPDIILTKLLMKVEIFSDSLLLSKLFRLHNINEHLQRKTSELMLKWNKNEMRNLIRKKIYSEDRAELIHATYFAGKHHFREFRERVNKLLESADKLIKYEAEQTSYRLN